MVGGGDGVDGGGEASGHVLSSVPVPPQPNAEEDVGSCPIPCVPARLTLAGEALLALPLPRGLCPRPGDEHESNLRGGEQRRREGGEC
jgi:hypothetical protein